jgi:hypothetical protein
MTRDAPQRTKPTTLCFSLAMMRPSATKRERLAWGAAMQPDEQIRRVFCKSRRFWVRKGDDEVVGAAEPVEAEPSSLGARTEVDHASGQAGASPSLAPSIPLTNGGASSSSAFAARTRGDPAAGADESRCLTGSAAESPVEDDEGVERPSPRPWVPSSSSSKNGSGNAGLESSTSSVSKKDLEKRNRKPLLDWIGGRIAGRR